MQAGQHFVPSRLHRPMSLPPAIPWRGCTPALLASASPANRHGESVAGNRQPPLSRGWGILNRRNGDFSAGVDSWLPWIVLWRALLKFIVPVSWLVIAAPAKAGKDSFPFARVFLCFLAVFVALPRGYSLRSFPLRLFDTPPLNVARLAHCRRRPRKRESPSGVGSLRKATVDTGQRWKLRGFMSRSEE